MSARKLSFVVLGAAAFATPTLAQVPDLMNSLDAGGRAMGMGGALYSTGSDTLSSYYNPAGLGYVRDTTVGAVYRNLPKSTSTASGELNDPVLSTTAQSGSREITHFGAVFPFAHGGLGLSYTVGGYIDDFRQGSVTLGGDPVNNFAERIRMKQDYFTLAYGHSSADASFSWGVGAMFVQQNLRDQRAGDVNGGSLAADVSGTSKGFGGIIGVQFNPRGSNTSYGLSYRSEIKLSGSDTTLLADKIPARLKGGIAIRQDGLRGGKDFLLYGIDAAHYFKVTNPSSLFDREDQTTFGFGAEYNYGLGTARVPLRFGYSFIPSGGDGYSDRNTLTFGIGYRPANNDYTIDLNFGRPQHGGFDLGLSLTYKLGSK